MDSDHCLEVLTQIERLAAMRIGVTIAAGLAFIVALSNTASAKPVEIESGLIEGVEESASLVFKGIPFAAPPIGDLRWRAPQPAPSWKTTKVTDQFSPICPQQGMYPPDAPTEPMNEDCLYLNVWTPANPSHAKLPVMVWLYGGALTNGSASNPLYSGAQLAKHNVIVVTANYRLGVLGFLAHPELSKEASYGSSGNYGLLDQIAALQWVQRNIDAFGGDPRNVTVYGQSSGSISISALATSPLATGLFQRAIGQSGGIFEPIELFSRFSLAGAEKGGEEFMRRNGAATLAQLRQKSPSALMETLFNAHLIVDGFVVTKPPYQAYRDGEENNVDLLLGTTADEGEVFLADATVAMDNFEQTLAKHFTQPIVWLMGPKPGASDQEARASAVAFEGDMRFRWDMWRWARLASDAGKRKVYFYQFSQTPPFVPGDKYFGKGAVHGMDMAYVFNNLEQQQLSWTKADENLAAVMSSYWTNFARSGDPNAPGLPAWPAFESSSQQALILNELITPTRTPNVARLEKIDQGYSILRFVSTYQYAVLAVALSLAGAAIWGFMFVVRRTRRR